MATETIQSDLSVSMAEFKKNPNEALRKSGGQTVAVLSHNKPVFYMVPPERYEAMLEENDDLHLVRLVKERLKQKDRAIGVSLDDLQACRRQRAGRAGAVCRQARKQRSLSGGSKTH